MILVSATNASSVYLVKQEPSSPDEGEPPLEESPIIMIDYAKGLTLDLFDFSFTEEGLTISFMNGSKAVDTLDIFVYVKISEVIDLAGLNLGIDNDALITSISLDLCDENFGVITNYQTFQINKEKVELTIDGEDLNSQAKTSGAYCIKLTTSISNWSPNTVYKLTLSPKQPEFKDGPSPMAGEADVYVLYDLQGGFLEVFNVSSTEEGMDISFSNSSVTAETIDLMVYASIEAIQYLSGFNATINNGAKILEVAIELFDDNLTLIEGYQAFDLEDGAAFHSVSLDPESLIERVKKANATSAGFRIKIGSWNSGILYTLHIQPFFREILYYETDDTVYIDPSTLNLPPELRVWWQQYNDTRSESWAYQDLSWEFGPRVHYEIFCYNTSSGGWYEVTPDTWIMFDSDLKINVTVPKLLFEDETELGQVELHWNMWAQNISAHLSISHNAVYDEWHSYSYIENHSKLDPYMGETAEFFTLDQGETYIVETDDYYNIKITGQFNDLTPKGIYHVELCLCDDRGNYIRGAMYYWSSETSTYKEVAIGGPWSEVEVYFDKMFGGTYTASIMNSDHELIHSVGFNETFIIKVDVNGVLDTDLANVSVVFPLPWGVKNYVNVTGWHEEYRVYHGGWVYDKALNNYVWDPNATIMTREWVYGSYLEEEWLDWNIYYKERNITMWEWDENTSKYHPYTYTEHVQPSLLMLYNNLDGSFGLYLAYEYGNATLMEDEWGGQWVEYRRCVEIEEAPGELTFYQLLNITKSLEEGKVSIEFKGRVVKEFITDLYLDYHIYSLQNEIWPKDWEWVEKNARFLSIDKPTVNIRVINDLGECVGDCVTDAGKWFMLEAKTEGSSDLKKDVDGIEITFRHHDYHWSENETIWSNLEIVVTVDLRKNTHTTLVYNETSKSVYEYGSYEIWNETTGKIEEVERWHWEYHMLNQTSGEWIKGGLPWHSADLFVNETYLTVNDFENFTAEDGRYIIQVNMSFTEQANNRRYDFDVMLLNWTYGPDYSKPWGKYLTEDWVYTTVYTVNDGSVEIYVPKPEEKSYVEDSKGAKYSISSKPYLEIKGEKLPLKEIKYWNGHKYEYRLLQNEWDYTTEQERYYYILENNTRIYVFEAYNALIYNVTLSSGESVLTFMEYTGWNMFNGKNYLLDLEGIFHWLEEDVYPISINQIGKVPVEFAGYFVLINGTVWEDVTKGWLEWDCGTGQNYIEFINGTRVYVKYDDESMYSWYFEKDGERYYIDWPVEYYLGEYNGSTIVVPGWYRGTWYFTLVNGERVEVPYEGSSSEYGWLSWWDLQRTKSEGGLVPEDDYAAVNGSLYLVNYYEGPDQRGYIILDGEIFNVTKGKSLYANILGNDVWNVTQIGFTMFLANLTDHGTYDMEKLLNLNVATEYHYVSDNEIMLFPLNGTSLTLQKRIRVMFFELKLNETTHYVTSHRPFFNYTTGTRIFYQLNGSRIEVPKSEDYEIVRAISKDLGGYTGQIPINFTWQGETYNTTLRVDSERWIELYYTYYCVDVDGYSYDVIPISVLEKTFTPWDTTVPRYPDSDPYIYRENFAIYNATLNNGSNYTLYPRLDHIRVVHPSWGHPYGWHLQEFPWESIAIRKQSYNIIVGAPEWGLWDFRSFKIVPETGALDLDGDLDTIDDQFYVKRVYLGDYSYTETRNGLDVNIVYDPNPVIPEDELTVNAWMGIATNSYRNTWNETYFWYYPNMTLVSPETMSLINETVWNSDRDIPNPGYWDISCMTINMTWEDYLRKAEKEGWHWVEEEAKWTWLWFGFEQSYWASTEDENGTFKSYHVSLRYEYSGMFVYNDTNGDSMMGEGEETHYFMPNAVSNVTFITPTDPEIYVGDFDDTEDWLSLPTNKSLEFGVSYLGINGTMFPFGRSYYAWYGEDVSGTDLLTFNERPVDTRLEELSFKIHFYVENSTETNSTEAHIKIDQHIGDWTLDIPNNIAVLENLSLSLNYYVYAEMGGSWVIKSGDGSPIDPNDIVEASRISLDASGLKFADVNMGDTYIWGGDLTMPYNVSSYTVPLNTFAETYTSYGSETSIGGWTFQSLMHFLSVGFPLWDGRYVYEDPEVVVYFGNGKKTLIGSPNEFLMGWNPVAIQPGEQPGGGGEQPGLGLPPIYFLASAVAGIAIAIISIIYFKKRRQIANTGFLSKT